MRTASVFVAGLVLGGAVVGGARDEPNHSDAESQNVYNRTGEWDSVFTGYPRDGFHWFAHFVLIKPITAVQGI